MNGEWGSGELVAGLVGAGALFLVEFGLSMTLVAVASLTHVTLHRMAAESEGRLAFLLQMQRPPSSYRGATLALRQLCLLGATLLLVAAARGAGFSAPLAWGGACGTLAGVLFIDLLAAPLVALRDPRMVLRRTAFLVRLAHALLYPVVRPVTLFLERIEARRQLTEEQREEEQDEEVEALIEVGEREGLLEAEESAMMRGIVDLDDTKVREIMTPRTDIVALPVESTVEQARKLLLEAGHSRLPVFRGSIDNIVGVLHVRDLFRAWAERTEQESISPYLRPPTYVPEPLSAAELLGELRLKTQLAIVVDEYGGVAGLVTLEDVLEEIVGEIRDEHEQSEVDLIEEQPDGSYLVHAVAHVKELEALFDIEFENRDFDTVGGLVVSSFGRVPKKGETLRVHGLEIEVLQSDRRRILQVRVVLIPPGEAKVSP